MTYDFPDVFGKCIQMNSQTRELSAVPEIMKRFSERRRCVKYVDSYLKYDQAQRAMMLIAMIRVMKFVKVSMPKSAKMPLMM